MIDTCDLQNVVAEQQKTIEMLKDMLGDLCVAWCEELDMDCPVLAFDIGFNDPSDVVRVACGCDLNEDGCACGLGYISEAECVFRFLAIMGSDNAQLPPGDVLDKLRPAKVQEEQDKLLK